MKGDTNIIVVILAIIGAVVVAGWLLKITFKLLGLIILLGIAAAVVIGAQKLLGKGS